MLVGRTNRNKSKENHHHLSCSDAVLPKTNLLSFLMNTWFILVYGNFRIVLKVLYLYALQVVIVHNLVKLLSTLGDKLKKTFKSTLRRSIFKQSSFCRQQIYPTNMRVNDTKTLLLGNLYSLPGYGWFECFCFNGVGKVMKARVMVDDLLYPDGSKTTALEIAS